MKKILFLLLLLPVFVQSQTVETIVGNGIAGYSGDNGLAIEAKINGPTSVRFDHFGYMYITDASNNVIRRVDRSGIIITVAGNGIAGYIGDNGPATNAELYSPNDVAFDAQDNMYIADWGNEVIRKVTPSGTITTFAGGGSGGLGDGGSAINAELNDPLGLEFDSAGNLYFADNGNHRVRKLNTSGIISTVAGTGIGGFSGDSGPADSAEVRLPEFINLSPSGDLYIPDAFNHRVRKVTVATGIINTIVGNGVTAYTGDGGPADSAEVEFPWSIAFDNTGNYFITDLYNGTIHKVDTAGIINTIAGNATAGYSGDGGPAIDAEFGFQAACTAIDPLGNLYVADYANNRIRRIVYTPTSTYTAVNAANKVAEKITIFPNPVATQLTIQSTAQPITQITITNLLGQAVYSWQSAVGSLQAGQAGLQASVDVSALPTGMYFVKVNDSPSASSGQAVVRKFLKE